MRNGKILFALWTLLSCPAFSQKYSPQEIQRQRQAIVTALLTTERQEQVSQQRWICINGREPSSVREARAMGFDSTPDASDSCIATLQRSAKDGVLIDVYKKFLAQTGGSPELSNKFPKAIGGAVLSGDGRVSIGNGQGIRVNASLAFDAGFTVAYTEAAAKKNVDPEKLKAVAESCLGDDKDAGTCFSVGYVYGAQAFNAR